MTLALEYPTSHRIKSRDGQTFDLSYPFKPRPKESRNEAFCLNNHRTLHEAVEINSPQEALERDLNQTGNIAFVGDIHLCHEFNLKEFDEFLDTLDKWIKGKKEISRVVIYGDLISKYDYRFTENPRRVNGKAVFKREEYPDVLARVKKAFESLDKLKKITGSIPVDFVYGNHEEELIEYHPRLAKVIEEGLAARGVNILTKDQKEQIDIGDPDDQVKLSHNPRFRWGESLSKRVLGFVHKMFEGLVGYIHFPKNLRPKENDIVIGGHLHIPVVSKIAKRTFVNAPSIIHNYAKNQPSFPAAFMVINPRASRKIHMVKTNGESLNYQAV